MKKLLGSTAGVCLVLFATSPIWADETPTTPVTDEVTQIAQAEQTDTAAESEPADVSITADTEEGAEEEAEEEETHTYIEPFSVSASISNLFNLGSIFRDEYTVTNYYLMSFGLSGSYQTPIDSLSASVSLSYNKYLTDAGGSTYQREGRFGDIDLSISYGSIYTDERYTGINLSGSLSFAIPTSRYSRFTNLYTTISPSIGLSRSFGKLSLSYRFGFSKNFNRDTSIVADLEDYRLDIIARDGGAENIGEAQIALDTGVLSSFSISNSFSLGYSWFAGFNTSLSFGFSDYWTYDNGTITEEDELTSPNAVAGRGHGQSMTGSLSASYSFLDYFNVSLAMSTSQQPLTSDNQSVRFPFFDLETGNLQNTSMSLTLSGSY